MTERSKKRREFWRKVRNSPRPRIVHVPRNIGGNAKGLSDAMRVLGASSFSISFAQDKYGFSSDFDAVTNGDSLVISELRRLVTIPRVLANFDIIHYNAGSTMSMPSLPPGFTVRRLVSPTYWTRLGHSILMSSVEIAELGLAKMLRRRLFVTFQGDDARQGDVSRHLFRESIAHHVGDNYYSTAGDKFKRRRIRRFKHFGVKMFALNPDLLHVLPDDAEFLPYTNADLNGPIDIRDRTQLIESRTRPVIVHAPSDRMAKGTDVIESLMVELQAEGFKFEFRLIENTPNSVARRIVETADLLIDQLYAGWYGGIAIEAMNAGVPVLCYLREDDLEFIPSDMSRNLPVINVTTETLKSGMIEFLVSTRKERRLLSEKCRAYVETWHSSGRVAGGLLATYQVGSRRTPNLR